MAHLLRTADALVVLVAGGRCFERLSVVEVFEFQIFFEFSRMSFLLRVISSPCVF
jgi:hypothetical protein